jgi:peptidoglycan/xylan/chitin deacetylase (PgdA/CDA1 family)
LRHTQFEMRNPGANNIAQPILHVGYKLPWLRALSSRSPIVLLYHGVPRKGDNTCVDGALFEQHVLFLKQYCDFVTQENVGKHRKALDKIRVLLNFDDGMRNNATVVAPILRRHEVPAVFFVCSRHATAGKYLWFTYLCALERHFAGNGFRFRGEFIDMTPAQRRASVGRLSEFLLSLTPHPAAMYQVIEQELPGLEDFISEQVIADLYAGMTAEQVGELASYPLFSVGIHTVDHPFLTKCNTQDLKQQIQQNKTWIESICNTPCNIIAYPSGDYNDDVIECNRSLGIARGYAVVPTLHSHPSYEIPRVGIYTTSWVALGLKAYCGNLMRRFGVRVG